MSNQIVKHEIDHLINLSLFRHRGDIYAVAKETGISIDYVKRIYHKLKKRRERDVSYWVASNIMSTIYEGYQQRTACLQKYLNLLQGNETVEVSVCCKRFVKKKYNKKRGELIITCSACKQACDTTELPKETTYELFFELIGQLREEDKSLVSFADDLGFTNKETPPAIKQNILVVDSKTVHIDPKLAEEVEKLSPIQREKTRKQLEQAILQSGTDIVNEQ